MATPAELRKQVQDMISAGKSEEEIGKFISTATTPQETVQKTTTPQEPEPTTFWGGVGKSLTSGEALGAGLQGAKGFLEGATLDIPETFIGGIEALMHPIDTIKSIPAGLRKIDENFQKAGSDPEAYGRMLGNIMGQPLTTYGIKNYVAPPILRSTGGVMRKYQPVSGLIPGGSRTFRNIERMMGRGMEATGKWLGGEEAATTPPTESPFRTTTGSKVGFEPSPEVYNPETPTRTMRGYRDTRTSTSFKPAPPPEALKVAPKAPAPTKQPPMPPPKPAEVTIKATNENIAAKIKEGYEVGEYVKGGIKMYLKKRK